MKLRRYTIGWWEKAEFPEEIGGGPTWEWKEKTFKALNEIHLVIKYEKEITELIEKYKAGTALHIMFFTDNINPPVHTIKLEVGGKHG